MTSKLSLRRKVQILAILLTLGFVTLELAVRLSGLAPRLIDQPYFQYDPDLPYAFKPNHHFKKTAQSGEFEVDFNSNSHGFLDTEWATKQEGELRIALIGDSFTAGQEKVDGIEYVDEVERLIQKEKGSGVTLLNFGVYGYWSEPERILLEKKVFEHQPDAVVVNFLSNDIIDMRRGLRSAKLGPSGKLRDHHEKALRVLSWPYIYSHFVRWALKILVIDNLPHNTQGDDFTEVYKLDKGSYKKEWAATLENYREMKRLCQKKNIPLILTYLCLPPSWQDDYIATETYLKNFCAREGIGFVSVRETLNQVSEPTSLWFQGDGHYTSKANRLVADKVSSYLLSLPWLSAFSSPR